MLLACLQQHGIGRRRGRVGAFLIDSYLLFFEAHHDILLFWLCFSGFDPIILLFTATGLLRDSPLDESQHLIFMLEHHVMEPSLR